MAIDQLDTEAYEQDLEAQVAAAEQAAEEQERERKHELVLAALQARHPDRVITGYIARNQRQLYLDKDSWEYKPVEDGQGGGSLVVRFEYFGNEGVTYSDYIHINNDDRGGLDQEIIDIVGLEAMEHPVVDVYPEELPPGGIWLG